MTTGSISRPTVTFIVPATPEHGQFTLNRTWVKTWSGADQGTPRKNLPSDPGLVRPWKYKKAVKRKRTIPRWGEHAYSMTKVWTEDSLFEAVWLNSGKPVRVFKVANAQNVTELKSHIYVDPAQEYKLLAKIRDQVYGSGFNPGVFLAEGPQALSMIGNAAVRLGAGIHYLRQGNLTGLIRALGGSRKGLPNMRKLTSKDAASLWLEVSYGWKPLISDMEEGAKYIASALNGTRPGILRKHRSWHQEIPATALSPNNVNFASLTVIHRIGYTVKALCASATMVPSLPAAAAVAWEILPYSFVADWAIPIGAYLDALRTASDITGTFIRTYSRDLTFNGYVRVAGDTTFKGPVVGTLTRREFSVSRTISSGISAPSPLSGIGLDMSSYWRCANAISLLIQRDWSALAQKFTQQTKGKS